MTPKDNLCRCPRCGKQLKAKNFVRHTREHGEKQHLCEVCNKKFSQKSNLKRHEKTHRETQTEPEETGCICHVCGKAYSRKDHLKKHFKKSHKNESFKCSTSSKQFSRKCALRRHEKGT